MHTGTSDIMAFALISSNDASAFKRYSAVGVVDAGIRRIIFEATGAEEARMLAQKWGFGLEGEIQAEPMISMSNQVEQMAYDTQTACEILGGISRTSLYRLLWAGELKRLRGTRKVLITRESISRYCAKAA